MFSLGFFFRHFFSGTVCLSSFAFTGVLFSVFSSEELEAFCCCLSCCKFECVGLFVCGFSRFSVCLLRVLCSTTGRRTCFRLLHFLGIQWPFQQLLWARSTSPSNKMAVVMAQMLYQSVPTFVAAFRADNLTARSPAWLFPQLLAVFFQRCFPHCFFFQLCITFHCSLSSVAGTLRLPPFLCLPSLLFLPPQARPA